MSADNADAVQTIHAVALLIGETGLLVTGASGAGKSALAAIVAAQWHRDPVRLIADDRVRLSVHGGRLVARPIAHFLGKIELRGLGIADVPAMPSAVVRLVLSLEATPVPRMPEEDLEFSTLLGIQLPSFRLQAGAEAPNVLMARWGAILHRLDHFC